MKSWKNGPGGAVLATFPPGKFGAAVDIGVSLGPEVAATEAVVQATNLDTPPNQQVFNEPGKIHLYRCSFQARNLPKYRATTALIFKCLAKEIIVGILHLHFRYTLYSCLRYIS